MTAPIPASSGTGRHGPHRLNRGGNRQLNAALHRIAITQARCHPPARDLLATRAQTIRETPAPPCASSSATYPTPSTAPSTPTPGA